MTDVFRLIWGAIMGFFRPRLDREAEIIALRHQLNVLRRRRPERLVFSNRASGGQLESKVIHKSD